MVGHVDEDLFTFLLGTLPTGESHRVEGHLDGCRRCVGLLAQASEEVAQLALALAPSEPPPTTRDGILAAARELNRFAGFAEQVAELLAISTEQARRFLDSLDEPSAWPGPAHATVRTLTADPTDLCEARFSRVRPATRFIPRNPGQDATVLILQGSCRDIRKEVYKVGDTLRWRAAALAELVALPGPDLIYLATA